MSSNLPPLITDALLILDKFEEAAKVKGEGWNQPAVKTQAAVDEPAAGQFREDPCEEMLAVDVPGNWSRRRIQAVKLILTHAISETCRHPYIDGLIWPFITESNERSDENQFQLLRDKNWQGMMGDFKEIRKALTTTVRKELEDPKLWRRKRTDRGVGYMILNPGVTEHGETAFNVADALSENFRQAHNSDVKTMSEMTDGSFMERDKAGRSERQTERGGHGLMLKERGRQGILLTGKAKDEVLEKMGIAASRIKTPRERGGFD